MTFATEAQVRAWGIRELRERYSACDLCPLRWERSRVVHGQGRTSSGLMVVGEAPGEAEDAEGRPFSPNAPAGSLLRKLCVRAGLDLESAWVTNSCLCAPPRRAPTEPEIRACSSRLRLEVELVRPRVLLLLGATAASAFGIEGGVGRNRGVVEEVPWVSEVVRRGLARVVLSWHPAAVLRAPTRLRKRVLLTQLAADLGTVEEALA